MTNHTKFCDNCNFSCAVVFKLDRHLQTTKHQRIQETATIKCELCEQLFTEAGYELHLHRNKQLISLWKKRDNWTKSGFDTLGWQIGFSDIGGHAGDDLPICNNFSAFGKKYGSFFEMRTAIISYWKKNLHRYSAGEARNPWDNLPINLRARHVPMSDELFETFCENRNRFDQELRQKQLKIDFPFEFTEYEIYYGFLINTKRSEGNWDERTVQFIEFLGFDRNYHRILLKIKDIVDNNQCNIVFVPMDENSTCKEGFFYFVDPDDTEEGHKPDLEIESICYFKYNPKSSWNDLDFDIEKTTPFVEYLED